MHRWQLPIRLPVIVFSLVASGAAVIFAEEPEGKEPKLDGEHSAKMSAGLKLFKEQVRGVLVSRCLDCHGGGDVEAEFDLSTRASLLRGGAEGAAIIVGDAKKSRLYSLITHKIAPEMPLDEQKLADEEIAAIARWIDLGAPYDKPLTSQEEDEVHWTKRSIDPAARSYWAFQPLSDPSPPPVKNQAWCRTDIDHFVLARQEAKGLTPNSPPERRVLIRRAHFDLIGLPPTPEEVARFVEDEDPQAYEKLIDRLLESPHHGERWGRHWLDVARFAESHGFEQDYNRPHAYHYRDFVIQALNDDMPYDQFVRWQLAGDEIAPENPQAMMATGFLGAGVFPTQLTEKEFQSARYDELDDMVGTMGTAMLGLTIGCARCHDHKYDPIPQADYYRLVSTFTTTIRSEIELEVPDPATSETKKTKVMVCSEGLPKMKHHADGRGFPHFYPKTHFLKRGDTNQKEGEAPQAFLQVLMRRPASGERQLPESSTTLPSLADPLQASSHWKIDPPDGWRTSYRRRSLANWITDTDRGAGHLLARVIVNRLWQHHLGRGIIASTNDLGAQGEAPTHPQLLDWLASDLIAGGWRLKRLHKLIMTSSVYMHSSDFDVADARIDPENRLLWRYEPRRLEAEVIRDAMLTVSGQLDTTMFGPGTLDEGMKRRSIYFMIKRSKLIPMMQLFDQPEPLVSQGDRPATTIAPQALLFMNNPHVRTWAKSFARRLAPVADKSLADAVDAAYQTALSRSATAAEQKDNVAFLQSQIDSYNSENKPNARELALTDFCQVVMSLNEFVYVE